MKFFDTFTNLYSLSKTLRFELKPVGKTQEMLEKNNVFEKDQTIDDSYNQAKFYFDTLHQKFIDSALVFEKVSNLEFNNFADFLEKQNKIIVEKKKELTSAREEENNKKVELLQKEVNEAEGVVNEKKKELYQKIRKIFDKEAEQWKKKYQDIPLENGEKIKFGESDLKQNGVKFLTASGILQVLKYEFPESKEREFKDNNWPSLYVEEKENLGNKRYIFDSFDKFSGRLSRFQQTRDNLYADDGIATAVSTRIVSNMEIFLANQKVFEEKYKNNHLQIGFNQTHIFDIDQYYNYLLQKNIEALTNEKDNGNSYNKIIGSINKIIKEYRDKKTSESKHDEDKKFKKSDYPLFRALEKQILGKVEKEKQLIEKTEDKTEEEILVDRFKEFITNTEKRFAKARDFIQRFFVGEFAVAYEDVYLKNATINTISRRWFVDHREFELALPQASKNKDERDEAKVKKFVTLADVKFAVEQIGGDQPFRGFFYEKGIITPEQNVWRQLLGIWRHEFESLFNDTIQEDGAIIKGYYSYLVEAKKLQSFSRENKEKIATIKNYADAALRIFQIMKYLALDERDRSKVTGQLNTDFYAELDEYAKDFEFIKYYTAFRNFITKKPFDENKVKISFDKGNLLGGWAESPEGNAQFCGYILRKGNKYFLGITDQPTILDLEKFPEATTMNGEYYEKMVYRQLKSITIYGSGYEGLYDSRYADDKKQLGEDELIERVKELLRKKYITRFPELKQLIRKGYKDKEAKDLAKDLGNLNLYSLEFILVNADYIERIAHDIKGKNKYLYIFEITNKDFNNTKSGKSNIHTLYFKNLFSKDNLKKPGFKLSGGAEIFFRPKTDNLKIRERNGEELTFFDKRDGNKEKPVLQNRRYSEDKIFFHLPIVINFGAGNARKFNQEINKQILAGNKDMRVIGVDRGEKHLAYYSVCDQKGEIIAQGSLNKINGVDYFRLLNEREKERLKNRQSWSPLRQIKDLKRGYISQVVHAITQLTIEHNAIVVLEDLNMRFKQIRGGIEKSIYQQLEKALIDKFGYLVFKDRTAQEKGGVLNGYQLTAPFVSFEKMGKQTGIIFYTQANYTSVTDPLTGFRKNVYISNSASQDKIKEAIRKFKAIGWDDNKKSYFFTYDSVDFIEEKFKRSASLKDCTVVYAKVPRIRREKDKNGYWECKPINLNEKFKELFTLWNFDSRKGDICEQIQTKESDSQLKGMKEFDGKERGFYQAFIYLFNLILQLRNSYSKQFKTKEEYGEIIVEDIGEDIDFISSPVKPFFSTQAVNKKGEEISPTNFAGFEKRISKDVAAKDKEKILSEFNGDANGAYNIARKGIMILNKITKDPENPKLYITNQEWDDAVSDWDKYISQTS